MTREEAIEALGLLRIFDAPDLSEAVEMAVSTLRAQQAPAKPDRSRWEGCAYCTLGKMHRMSWYRPDVVVRKGEYIEGDNSLSYIEEGSFDGFPETRMAELVTICEDGGDHTIGIKFCPICGKPLTEEAWAEMEGKIGGNDGTGDFVPREAAG